MISEECEICKKEFDNYDDFNGYTTSLDECEYCGKLVCEECIKEVPEEDLRICSKCFKDFGF